MIVIHIYKNYVNTSEPCIVVREDGGFPEWVDEYVIRCTGCGHVVGHVTHHPQQDEYGASTRVELT